MKSVRKIIHIDEELCNGCGQCAPDCAEGSLEIVGGKARLVADNLCDGLGACLGSCPTGALTIIERQADNFDQEAVDAYLAAKPARTALQGNAGTGQTLPESRDAGSNFHDKQEQWAGARRPCPSARFQIHDIVPPPAARQNAQGGASALSHWPVQIRLVPAKAPFLENCDLLVTADCAAVAHAGLHRDFLPSRVVMMGCPKFDDARLYVDRFREILATRRINSITILIMEVPCCSSMLTIIDRARELAKSDTPVRQVVISTRGEVIGDQA